MVKNSIKLIFFTFSIIAIFPSCNIKNNDTGHLVKNKRGDYEKMIVINNDSKWVYKKEVYDSLMRLKEEIYFDSNTYVVKVKTFYEKGDLREFFYMKDTLYDGIYNSYYLSGNLNTSGYFSNNHKTGIWNIFNDDDKNSIFLNQLFVADDSSSKLYMMKEYSPDGKIIKYESRVFISTNVDTVEVGDEVNVTLKPIVKTGAFSGVVVCLADLFPLFQLSDQTKLNCKEFNDTEGWFDFTTDSSGNCFSGFCRTIIMQNGEKLYSEPLYFHHCIAVSSH